ncbi:hypothetical protein E2C01_067174 [Portunus trituberculatus]|uniref:Uncharacterized protein n=1 Tax=Portunus trituberculatus TaxID=210409 RepID=A0A5B7HKA3_PORTR|nr:hypothetical protein [Portunus trituberculatus]
MRSDREEEKGERADERELNGPADWWTNGLCFCLPQAVTLGEIFTLRLVPCLLAGRVCSLSGFGHIQQHWPNALCGLTTAELIIPLEQNDSQLSSQG